MTTERTRPSPPWLDRENRPRLRGVLHQWAAVAAALVAIPAIALADGGGRLAMAVYGVSCVALFTTSAAYHRVDWSPRWLLRMKRADHIAIFVLIAGTYSAISLTALDGWTRTIVLLAAWTAVAGGALAALLGAFEKRGAANAAYITFGWLALLMGPQLVHSLTPLQLALVASGGVIYTAGAIMLALRRPDPRPDLFGYHEVWHVHTIVGAACHGLAVWLLAM